MSADGQNLSTDYVFDTLGNLRKTIQGEQSRYFTFDSLGRLRYSKQPEQNANAAFSYTDLVTGNTQWSVKYEYDDNGNITKTTDARGVYVEGTYYNFNRLRSRNYSDDTPDVTFWYDGTGLGSIPAYSKGKTTRVASSVSETRYTSFNYFGQLVTSEQRTPFGTESAENADPKVSGYEYDPFGRLLSQTYPSGRKVEFDYNLDGDISSIWGTAANGQNRLYLNGITYNAAGQMTRLRLGNGKWESTEYNDRLQVTEIGLGHSAEDQSIIKLEYGYGSITENNGSLRSQKITFAGLSNAYEQTYTYDDLNRLKSAEEKIGTATNWKQTFNYDRFGNRTFDAANTTTISQSNTVTNPSASTATNRLNGHTYDAAGNLTVDAENKRFVYDAENHQTKLFGPTNNSETPDAIYRYDGEGRRVKKISSSETTVFVYDGGGTLVAEYTALVGNDPAPTPRVSYLTQDHLGSPRVVTDQNGAVIKRTDWMAFGEEVEFNKRTAGLGYDEVPETRKGYTGYEKDEESGLDFAQARYYNPKHGRFTSVDPLTASARIVDPQSLNRYSYGLNSPYRFTDPLGLVSKDTGAHGSNDPSTDSGNGCPEGQVCEVDNEGNEYYIDAGGAVIYTTARAVVTVDAVKETVETVKEVEKVQIIESKWDYFWYKIWKGAKYAGKQTGKGLVYLGKGIGAAGMILLNPSNTGCAGLYEMSDGNGGCKFRPRPELEPNVDSSTENVPTTEELPPDRNPCPCLIRLGTDNQAKLTSGAEEARKRGYPYGVSTRMVRRISGTDRSQRWAPLSAVQRVFPGTRQTGNNPNHFTVAFPRAVDAQITDAFNSLFIRRN